MTQPAQLPRNGIHGQNAGTDRVRSEPTTATGDRVFSLKGALHSADMASTHYAYADSGWHS